MGPHEFCIIEMLSLYGLIRVLQNCDLDRATVYKGKSTLSKGILPCPKENRLCPYECNVYKGNQNVQGN